MQTMLNIEKFIRTQSTKPEGVSQQLLELVKIRVSQMNGCAYCLDMYTQDAMAADESSQRLFTLSAWRETPFFNRPERAALAWAEALTSVATAPVAASTYDEIRAHFSEEQITVLTLAINTINSWNRFAIGLGADVGSYTPGQFK
ncbi:carboxymuconolactone decarboxylase family protein [Celerinatantimonas diazotrophica]